MCVEPYAPIARILKRKLKSYAPNNHVAPIIACQMHFTKTNKSISFPCACRNSCFLSLFFFFHFYSRREIGVFPDRALLIIHSIYLVRFHYDGKEIRKIRTARCRPNISMQKLRERNVAASLERFGRVIARAKLSKNAQKLPGTTEEMRSLFHNRSRVYVCVCARACSRRVGDYHRRTVMVPCSFRESLI